MGKRGRRITFVDGVNETRSDDATDPTRWWTATTGSVGNAVSTLASQIETGTWNGANYMDYVCQRLMTGRATASGFGYSMTRRTGRAAASMASATWQPPALNVVATAADVFHQKIFKNKPWLQFLPTVKGSYKTRSQCKSLGQFVDAAFDQLDVFAKTSMCGTDCMQYRSAFIKVGSDLARNLKITRVLANEILLTPEQSGTWTDLTSVLQRVFLPKDDVIAATAKLKDADAIRAAVENSPGVYPGYYTSTGTDYSQICALVEGWKLPDVNGENGRHVLAVGDCVIVDEKWERDALPFAKLSFNVLTNEQLGQSMAEMLLPLQRSIDRLSASIDETEQRWSFPRYFVETSSNVDTDQFGMDFVEYAGTKPEKDASNSVPKELYESLESRIAKAFTRVGISQGAAGGQKPEGLSSGLAILAWNQVDDSRHVDLAERYEKFIVDIGELVIAECAVIKPKFTVEGDRVIKWEDVELNSSKYKITCFPISRLPQTLSAKYEQINQWYLNGTISRADKMRAENMPDLLPMIDANTASADWVERVLDSMVENGKYIAPSPYIDVKSAKTASQARFLYEQNHGMEDSRLKLLNRFISALRELPVPPPPAPLPGMPGALPTSPVPPPAPGAMGPSGPVV